MVKKKKKFTPEEAEEYHFDMWDELSDKSGFYKRKINQYDEASLDCYKSVYKYDVKAMFHLKCKNFIAKHNRLLTKQEKQKLWNDSVSIMNQSYAKQLKDINELENKRSIIRKYKIK